MPTMAFQEHSHQAVESQKSTSLFPFESKREVGGQSDGTYLRVSPIFPLPSCSRAASCVCFASITQSFLVCTRPTGGGHRLSG